MSDVREQVNDPEDANEWSADRIAQLKCVRREER
jgi:hypothetical protein